MSDLVLHQLQALRAENTVRHEEVLVRFDRMEARIKSLDVRVCDLEDRVSSIEVLIVRQQRQLYEMVDRQAMPH